MEIIAENNIKVSVIIPVYNAELYIEEAINSCLHQNLGHFKVEVIAVDDNSSDSSVEILRKISDRYENVHYIRLTRNRGPAGARNEGIKKAKGQFIAFLDADDYMASNKLNSQLDYFHKNPSIDLIITGLQEIDERGKKIRNFIQSFPEGKYEQAKAIFLDKISSVTPTIVLRKDVMDRIGYFDEELIHFEDKEFLLRALKQSKIIYLSKPLTVRRVIKSSFSNIVDEDIFLKSREKFYNLALNHFPKLERLGQDYWKKQLFGLGRLFQKKGEFKKSREYYKKSLGYSFYLKATLGFILSFFPGLIQKKISSIRF